QGNGGIRPVGLVLLGLVPLVWLVGSLAGRFDAGLGVWHDLILMLADGQIGVLLALFGCLYAGSGVAIVALAGSDPRRPAPQVPLQGEAEISVRKQAPPPEPELPAEEPEPAQPEPERDPRLWSKPRGWISPPPGSRRPPPGPAAPCPIPVRPPPASRTAAAARSRLSGWIAASSS